MADSSLTNGTHCAFGWASVGVNRVWEVLMTSKHSNHDRSSLSVDRVVRASPTRTHNRFDSLGPTSGFPLFSCGDDVDCIVWSLIN